MTKMLKRLFTQLQAEADKGGGGGETPEQIAARETSERAAHDGKTVAEIAADTAAQRVDAEKAWKPEQIAAADAAAKAATDAGKTPDEIANAREEAARAAADSKTGSTPPEKYELVLPESSTFTQEDVKAFEGWARSLGLTQAQAQQAIDEQVGMVEDRLAQFKEETGADPDYGGDKMDETQRLANAVLDLVRPKGHARREGLLRILEGSGYINNIEVISFLADLGRMAAEDPGGSGSGGGGEKKPLAHRMFPSSAPKS